MDIRSIKSSIKEVISLCNHFLYTSLWNHCAKNTPNSCLNHSPRKTPIVVSLTTFPGRIHLVHETIRTILIQKGVKPDVVELWLAQEQFPNGEQDLPGALVDLKKHGLDICWCSDTRSYKKLIPALEKHPNAIIVTADDDVYYRRNWLEKLYTASSQNPGYVYCHRATQFYLEGDTFRILGGGRHYYRTPSYLNKLVGVGGVLYTPGILHPEVADEALFMQLAPTNDDIWFWFMAVQNDVRVCVVEDNQPRPVAVVGAEKTDKLTSINDQGEMKFWQQFRQLLQHYPTIEQKLRQEYLDAQKG